MTNFASCFVCLLFLFVCLPDCISAAFKLLSDINVQTKWGEIFKVLRLQPAACVQPLNFDSIHSLMMPHRWSSHKLLENESPMSLCGNMGKKRWSMARGRRNMRELSNTSVACSGNPLVASSCSLSCHWRNENLIADCFMIWRFRPKSWRPFFIGCLYRDGWSSFKYFGGAYSCRSV